MMNINSIERERARERENRRSVSWDYSITLTNLSSFVNILLKKTIKFGRKLF